MRLQDGAFHDLGSSATAVLLSMIGEDTVYSASGCAWVKSMRNGVPTAHKDASTRNVNPASFMIWSSSFGSSRASAKAGVPQPPTVAMIRMGDVVFLFPKNSFSFALALVVISSINPPVMGMQFSNDFGQR
jgi:hypothetical protein